MPTIETFDTKFAPCRCVTGRHGGVPITEASYELSDWGARFECLNCGCRWGLKNVRAYHGGGLDLRADHPSEVARRRRTGTP